MKKVTLMVLVYSLMLLNTNTAIAQDDEPDLIESDQDHNHWRIGVTPYAWLASQATDVGGEKIRQSFNDVYSITNSGFQLVLNARYKRFLFSADGTFAHLQSGIKEAPLDVDIDILQYILHLKTGYLVYSNYEYENNDVIRGWSIEATIGAKYWSNDVEVNYSIQLGPFDPIEGKLNELQSYWDPMVGVGLKFFLSRKVLLSTVFDYGGFNIGDASKYSYDFTYANSFLVANWAVVHAGYRSFKYNRTDGEGDDEVETTVSAFGPVLGVSFIF